jgi:hypothetical protein
MWSLERDVPLAACPNLSCSQRSQCFLSAAGGHCLKTHYRDRDEFCDAVVAIIDSLRVPGYVHPETIGMTGNERASYVYKLLRDRAEQEGWIV